MRFPKHVIGSVSGIYAITCLSNGKVYVGSAACLRRRYAQHVSELRRQRHHGVRLQRAWVKHGERAFLYEVLEVCDDPLTLIVREQLHIDLLDAAGSWGYNSAPTAGSMAGFRHSQITKQWMSDSRKGKPVSDQAQKASTQFWLGRKHSTETLRRMRNAKTGTVPSPATQEAARAANLGHSRKHSDETKAKISAATKGRVNSVNNRIAVSRACKGVKWTPERIAKRVATLKANRTKRSL